MKQPKYDAYYRLYTVLFLVLFLGFLVGMALYGEQFRFWRYPYSGLGATVTENGYPNGASLVVFVTDMTCIGIILATISAVTAGDGALPHRGVRSVFAASGAFGAVVATFPHNLFPVQHTLGSAFLVGSLWVLSLFVIQDVHSFVSVVASRWLQWVLQVTVVSYAITYVLNAATKQLFQKFAVFGLCAVLLSGWRMLARASRHRAWREGASAEVPARPAAGVE